MLLQHNNARTILKAFTLKRSNFSPPVSSYIENKPASHHPPAASNIQLPRGIQCYWETMTMSTTSTVMQRVCACPCDTFHSGSPMTFLLYSTYSGKFFLFLAQPPTQPHTHTPNHHQLHNMSRGEINTWLRVFFFCQKRCIAAIYRN